ncbi:NmrA family NAD(P)-binding protein [Burkholderia sp. Ac-20379]|uniref:NmrA family NAD(P)-binding protein n=1 Tax=Burkholderia sp. Ac-20379 TaxID=2703900 RepID=UPI00197D5B38|nr:NmrA family NAD(P)-binding protein [Burkholderia sp. Ac-20379]MBN3725205.1 NmrA family NAD(P)-binding protein [Burkholderia sp. Ac-20379]
MSNTIFVTGAAGKLGKLVIQQLLARGVAPARIVAGSRDPQKLADLTAQGVAVRRADFEDPAGLAEAFAGVGTVLIVSTDALDGAGTRLKQHRNAVAAAAAAGVGRIAYTSLPNPESSQITFAPDHAGTERAIRETGLPYLIFRNNWYQQNLLMSLPHSLEAGQWYSSAQGGRIAYAAREEMAEAIAAALDAPVEGNPVYTLTGPQALNTAEVAELATKATGRPLAVVRVDGTQLAAGLKDAGLPDGLIAMLVSIDADVRAGNLSIVTDHLETLIGRAPQTLAQYFEANKADYLG